MKYLLHVFTFLLFFQIEVRVRASGNAIYEAPEGCWKKSNQCAIHVNDHAAVYDHDDLKLTATKNSVIIREKEKSWRFVEGQLWVEAGENIVVQTLFADLKSGRGQFWVLKENENIRIRNISADLTLFLKDGKKLQMPEGFEVWISGIDQSGNSKMGMPEPIDMEKHLSLWNEYYRGTPQEFKVEVMELKKSWGNLTEKSSQLYGQVVDRYMANEEELKQKHLREKVKKEREAKKQKDLYFDKVFNR